MLHPCAGARPLPTTWTRAPNQNRRKAERPTDGWASYCDCGLQMRIWRLERSILADEKDWGESEYKRLEEYSAMRYRELSSMVGPYIGVTDRYGELICKLVLILGQNAPRDEEDEGCRDLIADCFDFLHDSRRSILESKFSIAFPLLRRALESISLLAVCSVDSQLATKWASGEKVPNSVVRKRLSEQPIAESLEATRDLYNFFSQGAHPNRALVPHRLLGKGNRFVLGASAVPDLLFFCKHCREHLSLWFWFCAAATFRYRDLTNRAYGKRYLRVAADAKEVGGALVNEMNRLRSHSE